MSLRHLLIVLFRVAVLATMLPWCVGTALEGIAAVGDREWLHALRAFGIAVLSAVAAAAALVGMGPWMPQGGLSFARLLISVTRLLLGGLAVYWCVGLTLEGVGAAAVRDWPHAFAALSVAGLATALALAVLLGMRPLGPCRKLSNRAT
jgi:hypothetical protein